MFVDNYVLNIDLSKIYHEILSVSVHLKALQIHIINAPRQSFRTSETCPFHISRFPGNSREIWIGIPALPGNGLPGNRATLGAMRPCTCSPAAGRFSFGR